MKTLRMAGGLAAVLCDFGAVAWAHESRAGYLELREPQPGSAIVSWRLSFTAEQVSAILPSECRIEQKGEQILALHCEKPLAGQVLNFGALRASREEILFQIALADGTEQSVVIAPSDREVTLPARSPGWQVLCDYLALGVTHILAGPDHILFLLGLLVLAAGLRVLLFTVTAFTVAHSITLCATALGLLQVSAMAAEACIALSLVVVALEIGDAWSSRTTSRTHPAAIAFPFGLVHGLGFASALSEVGLPRHAIPLSLLGFNLGVEVGQVGIVLAAFLAVLMVGPLAVRWRSPLEAHARFGVSYVIGIAGCYWLFSRLLRFAT